MKRKTNAQRNEENKNKMIKLSHDCSDIISSNSHIFCPDGHRFCRICVRQYIQNIIMHQQKYDHVKCFNSDCKYQLDLEKISRMINQNDFKNLKAKVNQPQMKDMDYVLLFFLIPICIIIIFYMFCDLINHIRL